MRDREDNEDNDDGSASGIGEECDLFRVRIDIGTEFCSSSSSLVEVVVKLESTSLLVLVVVCDVGVLLG